MEKAPNNTNDKRVFVGRTEELNVLSELYKKYLEGNALVATLTGEPGIGKIFFVENFFRKYKNCNFVYGKNGQLSDKDYGAVSQIIEQLTNMLLHCQKKT